MLLIESERVLRIFGASLVIADADIQTARSRRTSAAPMMGDHSEQKYHRLFGMLIEVEQVCFPQRLRIAPRSQ